MTDAPLIITLVLLLLTLVTVLVVTSEDPEEW
jgi:hypothetical protein